MNLLEAIEKRKSVRSYKEKPVDRERLEEIVNAGNLAPVYGEFHITVIENAAYLKEINDVTLDMMKHSGNDFAEKRAATPGYAPLYGAPTLIVLSAPNGNESNGFNMANVSLAAENMITEATGTGLGSCFVMGPMLAFKNEALKKKLHLPEGYEPLAGILVGHAKEALTKNKRKAANNVNYVK